MVSGFELELRLPTSTLNPEAFCTCFNGIHQASRESAFLGARGQGLAFRV